MLELGNQAADIHGKRFEICRFGSGEGRGLPGLNFPCFHDTQLQTRTFQDAFSPSFIIEGCVLGICAASCRSEARMGISISYHLQIL